MAIDVTKTLRAALTTLQAEQDHIEKQIAAIRGLVGGNHRGPLRARRAMSPAARRAVSRRMKAYWAKRRATKKK
jgi:hypothetical protein